MPTVVFIDVEGRRREVDAEAGQSLMEAARANGIEAIEARCGGMLACATCHVYVDETWVGRLDPPDEFEREMIVNAIDPRPTSRLSCQIRLDARHDGLIVRTPERQS
jgi:2Fe-2S ferredoxin